jgi:hypothetical protein
VVWDRDGEAPGVYGTLITGYLKHPVDMNGFPGQNYVDGTIAIGDFKVQMVLLDQVFHIFPDQSYDSAHTPFILG